MSRDSRLAKRGAKLKKLAAKHGAQMVVVERSKTFLKYAVQKHKSQQEMRRAVTKVAPEGGLKLIGTTEEKRAQFEAHLLAIANETKLTINGSRDKQALALGFAEHLARVEHAEYVAAEKSLAAEGVVHVDGKAITQHEHEG